MKFSSHVSNYTLQKSPLLGGGQYGSEHVTKVWLLPLKAVPGRYVMNVMTPVASSNFKMSPSNLLSERSTLWSFTSLFRLKLALLENLELFCKQYLYVLFQV